MTFKYEISDQVLLKVPEYMYSDDRPVEGVILDRRMSEQRGGRSTSAEYLISHPYDTSGEWRFEEMIVGPSKQKKQSNPMTNTTQQPKSNFAKNGRVRPPANTNYQPATQQTPSLMPAQPSGDFADRISDAISKSFSPGGLINLGGGTFLAAGIINLGFWGSVTAGIPVGQAIEKILMRDWAVLGSFCGGLAISTLTTFFQTYPIVAKKDGDSIAKQFLASLFRPDLASMRGGEYELAKAHGELQKNFWKLMGWMWFFCTCFEVLAGIVCIGNVFGQGMASFWSLVFFIASIVGCQIGSHWVVQGRNMRLPQSGRGLIRRLEQKSVSNAYNQLK